MNKKYDKFVMLLCSLFMFICMGAANADDATEEQDKGSFEIDRIEKFNVVGFNDIYSYGEKENLKKFFVDVPVQKENKEFGVYFPVPKKYISHRNAKPGPEFIELYVFNEDDSERLIDVNTTRHSCTFTGSTADSHYKCRLKKILADGESISDYKKFVVRVYDDLYDKSDSANNADNEIAKLEGELLNLDVSLESKDGLNDVLVFTNTGSESVKITKIKSGKHVLLSDKDTGLEFVIDPDESLKFDLKLRDTSSIEGELFVDSIKFSYVDDKLESKFSSIGQPAPVTTGEVKIALDSTVVKEDAENDIKRELIGLSVRDGCAPVLMQETSISDIGDLSDLVMKEVDYKDIWKAGGKCQYNIAVGGNNLGEWDDDEDPTDF